MNNQIPNNPNTTQEVEKIPEYNFGSNPNFQIIFNELTAQAVDYSEKKKSAKTNLKKEYYDKKLKKINKKIYGLLALSMQRNKT